MKYPYKNRELFNRLIAKEYVLDTIEGTFSKDEKVFLDIGCGECILLSFLKKMYPFSGLFCVEKIRHIHKNCENVNYISLTELEKSSLKIDASFMLDVIHFLDEEDLIYIIKTLKKKLKSEGIIYILTGIYEGSKGLKIFQNILKYDDIRIYKIEDLLELFESLGFKYFLKRLPLENIFGIMPPNGIPYKEYLNYIYSDKLLIKLIHK